MDGERFDSVARALVRGMSRRAVVAAAAILAGARLDQAAANHSRKFGQLCKTLCKTLCRVERPRGPCLAACHRRCRGSHGGTCPGIGDLCGPFSPDCCRGLVCTPSIVPLVTSCMLPCETDQECRQATGEDVACRPNAVLCPFLSKCCWRQPCSQDADCAISQRCCPDGFCRISSEGCRG